MKTKLFDPAATKKGVTSLYVVIFTTILFGVITLSFIRIIVSESSQTSNDDLSQSAYDSALAGVEDAKIAVNKYYECLSNPSSSECTGKTDPKNLFEGNCDSEGGTFKLKKFLYGSDQPGEVLIEETDSAGNATDQAYTCVILRNTVPDYRATLTSDTQTRVVPIGIRTDGSEQGITSSNLDEVKSIQFSWYSELNGTEFKNLDNDGKFKNKTNSTTPPTISLTLLYTNPTFTIGEFNNSTNTNYSTLILLPSNSAPETANGVNNITAAQISAAANSDAGMNNPFLVHCTHNEFACTVNLETNFPAGGNAMLVVTMPYGDTITDFAVTLKKADGSSIDFENVQISVDSTGRANQLVRRVETRLDPADLFFPYPGYEVTLTGGPGETLSKNFWITANCWNSKTKGASTPDNIQGDVQPCPNNGSL